MFGKRRGSEVAVSAVDLDGVDRGLNVGLADEVLCRGDRDCQVLETIKAIGSPDSRIAKKM
jgi:hypothetical protein